MTVHLKRSESTDHNLEMTHVLPSISDDNRAMPADMLYCQNEMFEKNIKHK